MSSDERQQKIEGAKRREGEGAIPADSNSPHRPIAHSPTPLLALTRRTALKTLLGASTALALGLPGCKRKPHREIVSRPDDTPPHKPGKVLHYASTWTEGPYPYGMLVKTVDGRPIKIDGNPDHPINRGASTAAMQASILSLYDPDRLKGPLMDGQPTTWQAADERIIAALREAKRVLLMTPPPWGWAESVALYSFWAPGPEGVHLVHEPAGDHSRHLVDRKIYEVHSSDSFFTAHSFPRLDRAAVIVSLDCDFLGTEGAAVENIRLLAKSRSLEDGRTEMSRFYAIESAMTVTGANADHRIRMRPSQMFSFASALRETVAGRSEPAETAQQFDVDKGLLARLVNDLRGAKSKAVVLAGGHLPPAVHATVALLNNDLDAYEKTLGLHCKLEMWSEPAPQRIESFIRAGIEDEDIDVLIMLGVNPVYDWPGGGDEFKQLMSKIGLTVGHGLYLDETLSQCTIALPSNHNLESWNEANPRLDVGSLCQPVIAPLYDTRQEAESLLRWAQARWPEEVLSIHQFRDWHDYIRDYRWPWSVVPREQTATSAAETEPEETPATQPATQPAATQSADTQPASQPASTQPARVPPSRQELLWQDLLRKGGWFEAPKDFFGNGAISGSFNPEEAEKLASPDLATAQPASANSQSEIGNPKSAFELVILPHHAICDGRFANNAWLQELPDPINKTVWGNFASISPASARELGVAEGDFVTVTVGEPSASPGTSPLTSARGSRSVTLPVLIQPGQADRVVVTTLGHGRTAGGSVAVEAGGVNVAPLLGRENPDHPRVAFNARVAKITGVDPATVLGRANPNKPPIVEDVKLARPGSRGKPVRTQTEFSQHGRPIILAATLEEYRRDPAFVQHLRHLPEAVQTFPPYDYSKGHKWGMVIDLNACVGCGACATACQAENNIPVVGRDECDNGRHMHWLRVDRYVDGDENDPAFAHMVMLCQQCDTAPCETVCPVNATAHSPEGLNEMAYNRCVGTRYCQNNCPYKVRRFNFLRYHQFRLREPVQELVFNPDVTVRSVGVMEKCTFCVQRINEAKFKAFNDDVALRDGQIQTACQQACPAGAIVFGDLNDPTSRVAKLAASPRAYRVLEELNTKPAVTYLARVDNRRPAGKE